MRLNFAITFALALSALITAALPLQAQTPPAFARDTALVMVDDRACVYCAKWDRDVSAAYQASEEGRFAPLERRRKGHPDLTGIANLAYTPTFVLIVRGQEVGRIIGYGGEDHFWGELDRLMVRAGYRPGQAPSKVSPLQETLRGLKPLLQPASAPR
jgi:hypothetical protein